MEQITTKIKDLNLNHLNLNHSNLLPGTKIKLKDDDTIYIFIWYTNDTKYVIINDMDKQIYNNTIICSSIENIII